MNFNGTVCRGLNTSCLHQVDKMGTPDSVNPNHAMPCHSSKRWQRHASSDRRAPPSIQPIRSFNLGRMLPYNDECVNTDVCGEHTIRVPHGPAQGQSHSGPWARPCQQKQPRTTSQHRPQKQHCLESRAQERDHNRFQWSLMRLLLQGFSGLGHSCSCQLLRAGALQGQTPLS